MGERLAAGGRALPVLLAALLAVQAAMHVALIGAMQFSDEGTYLAMGKFVSQGEIIYRDFFDYHSPGTTLVAAAAFSAFGPSYGLARMLALAAQLGVTLLLFFSGREWFGENAALLGAAVYALTEPTLGGIWFVAEPFLAFFTLASFALFYSRYYAKGPAWLDARLLLPASGIAAGLAAAFKQPGAAFAFFVFLAIAATGLLRGERKERVARDLASFSLGAALPWLLLAAYFALAGGLWDAAYWLVYFPVVVKNSRDAGFFLETPGSPMFLVAAAALVACLLARRKVYWDGRGLSRDALALGFIAFACVTGVPRFNAFHVMAAFPVLSLLSAEVLLSRIPPKAGSLGKLVPAMETLAAGFAAYFVAFSVLAAALLALHPGESAYALHRELACAGGPLLAVPFDNFAYFFADCGHASYYIMLDPVWATPEMDARAWEDVRAKNATVEYVAEKLNGKCLKDFAPVLFGGLKADYEVYSQPGGNVFVLKPKSGETRPDAGVWDACK